MSGSLQRRWRRQIVSVTWALAFVAYLVTVAACTGLGDTLPATVLLAVFLAAALARAVNLRRRTSATFIAANLTLVVTVLTTVGPHTALSVTLVVVQATVSAVFFRSLQRGRVDLVSQIALGIRPQSSSRVLSYTRGVSWAWAWFMAALALGSLVLTFVAPPRLWWWWNNVGAAALPISFFCIEWLLRQVVLRHEDKPGVARTLRGLARLNYQSIFRI